MIKLNSIDSGDAKSGRFYFKQVFLQSIRSLLPRHQIMSLLLQHDIDMIKHELLDLSSRFDKKLKKEQKELNQAQQNIKIGQKYWNQYQNLKEKERKLVSKHEGMELLFEQQIRNSRHHIHQLQNLENLKSIKFVFYWI